jgi:hypothetical protein
MCMHFEHDTLCFNSPLVLRGSGIAEIERQLEDGSVPTVAEMVQLCVHGIVTRWVKIPMANHTPRYVQLVTSLNGRIRLQPRST